MGYLDNQTVTVEAILTKKGREILAQNGQIRVVKFALADDEVDYRLWNESHPNGSNYYGAAIENMPVLEANSDETQVMRYKLITLPKTQTRIPTVTIGTTSIRLYGPEDSFEIAPNTLYGVDQESGYSAIIHNVDYAYLVAVTGNQQSATVPSFLGDIDKTQSQTVVGNTFRLVARDIRPYLTDSGVNVEASQAYVTTTLTVVGNDTGASTSVTVTVYKDTVTQAQVAQSTD